MALHFFNLKIFFWEFAFGSLKIPNLLRECICIFPRKTYFLTKCIPLRGLLIRIVSVEKVIFLTFQSYFQMLKSSSSIISGLGAKLLDVFSDKKIDK